MARPGVTYIEVSNAAQQLTAAGKSPTIEMIRNILGTGSNSTLGAHLRSWRATLDKDQQIATKEKLPEILISSIKGLWEQVMNQSDEKIQTIQLETQQVLATSKQEIQQLHQDNAHWQQQYQHTKQERDGFSAEKSTVEQLLSQANIEIATLAEKLVGSEQHLLHKQARIHELGQQNQQVQSNLEHFRAASLEQRMADKERYEQQQKQIEHSLSQTKLELNHVTHEKMAFQQQSQQAYFERDSLQSQLNKLNVQYEAVMARHAESVHDLAKKTQDLQHWQAQSQGLQEKWNEQNILYVDLQKLHAVLSQQLLQLAAELKEINDQNKVLAHDKWILGQEKAQLLGQLMQLESCA